MRSIVRPRPNNPITVSPFRTGVTGTIEHLVRVGGFDPTEYLTPAEALQLARALDAAADELIG
jgi:hypothetical protein